MSNNIITPICLDMQLSTQGRNAGARTAINLAYKEILANESWVKRHNSPTYPLRHPIHVQNIDDTINKAGLIKSGLDANLMVWDRRGRMHTEHVQMFITNLGKENILLGIDWLKYHDPSIRWRCREVHISFWLVLPMPW